MKSRLSWIPFWKQKSKETLTSAIDSMFPMQGVETMPLACPVVATESTPWYSWARNIVAQSARPRLLMYDSLIWWTAPTLFPDTWSQLFGWM